MMLAGRPIFARLFNVAFPVPPIHADLNGIFLIAVAAGYVIPYRDPESRSGRSYLWVMGALLKGAGALTFALDYVFRGSPSSFLLFAATDGTLAVLTLWALSTSSAGSSARQSR